MVSIRPCRRESAQRSRSGRSATGMRGRGGVEAVQPRVGHEERVDVPEREHAALDLGGRAVAEVDVVERVVPGIQPAHHVRAHALGGFAEVDGVAPTLVHRAAGFVVELLVDEDRLVWRLVPDGDAHEEHGVEPQPDLLAHLGDEVRRVPVSRTPRCFPGSRGLRRARCRRPARRRRRRRCAAWATRRTRSGSSRGQSRGGAVRATGPCPRRRALRGGPWTRSRSGARRTCRGRRGAAGPSSGGGRCSSRPCCAASRPCAPRRTRASSSQWPRRRAWAGGLHPLG